MKGFTLIELLVVVLIIGILASVALPQYQKAKIRVKITDDARILHEIYRLEKLYYLANGTYTRDLTDLDADFNFPHDSYYQTYKLPSGTSIQLLYAWLPQLNYSNWGIGYGGTIWLDDRKPTDCRRFSPNPIDGNFPLGDYGCKVFLETY